MTMQKATSEVARRTIPVYVRKGSQDDERVLSFRTDRLPRMDGAPEGPWDTIINLDQDYLLSVGFALDGHSAAVTVRRGTRIIRADWDADAYFKGAEPDDLPEAIEQPREGTGADQRPMTDALREVQTFVRDLLDRMGYGVRFV